ncbi:MAG: hypothetical protein JWN85_3896 [Gammaproteobacteria bacterium]|nr:hypothetical protein [Gammaproteobacteria bacterium]
MGSRGLGEASFRRGSVIVPAAFLLLTAASESRGAAPGYEISAGIMESDNVQRLPSGGSSDTIATQEAVFTWHDKRPRLDADIDADLSHLTYLRHTFGDQVIGNFIGQARAVLVQQLLFWDFSENFGQGAVDPFAALTPANRENINYFSTGPRLLLPLGGDNLLNVAGSYGKVNYQTSPLDSNRMTGSLGVIHNLSIATAVSVNVRDERVEYASQLAGSNYDSQSAYVRFDTRGNRTVIGADVGYGRLREPGSSPSNLLAHLELSRKISGSSTLAASFGHEYSDAAGAFRLTQTIGGANLNSQPVLQTGTPFTNTYGTFAWNFARSRTAFGMTLSRFKETYVQGSNLDNNRTQIDAQVSRQLTPTVQVGLIELYRRQQFQNNVGDFSESTSDARLTWRAGRNVSLFFDYSFAKRQSDLSNTDYKENRVWLSIGYGRAAQVPPGPPVPPLPNEPVY